jgi:hypothetical protein
MPSANEPIPDICSTSAAIDATVGSMLMVQYIMSAHGWLSMQYEGLAKKTSA